MTASLVIAVPSKGRLQENANAFFGRAGLTVTQPGGARNYRGRIAGLDGVEIAFLSASEIARELAQGGVHLGVTGEDLIRESIPGADEKVYLVTPLGFGHADVVVAVPEAWIDVRTMADLDDVAAGFRARHGRRLRVATKYLNITRHFFAEHGIVDYRIVESLGATEGTPASGAADLIVDITSTGSTLVANALKVLDDGVMLRSEANLVASLTADWDAPARDRLRIILDRIAAEERARTCREVRATVDDPAGLSARAAELFGASAPFPAAGSMVTLHCPARRVYDCAAWLRDNGAGTVTVGRLDYVFASDNPLFDALADRLPKA
ncbi:MAG: ATP phosphoribosyltransferase [Hyphomicrobiales bacterium]